MLEGIILARLNLFPAAQTHVAGGVALDAHFGGNGVRQHAFSFALALSHFSTSLLASGVMR